ncbi:hypothetical protein ACET3Z_009993 [Daucus carota]
MRAELIFIPAPGVGHLVSAVELAKLLARQDHRISINILIIKMPFDYGVADFTQTLQNDAPERINFVDIPSLDDTAMAKLMALPRMSFHDAFFSSQRTQVRDVVRQIMNRSEDSRLGGFVLDMFCTQMMDVANEFDVPAYVFFASSASFLGFIFYAQHLKDEKDQEIFELKDSDVELSVPCFSNLVPAKVLPSVMLTESGSAMMISIARRLRQARGILVNTVLELENYAIKSLEEDESSPRVYHLGPLINFKKVEQTSHSQDSDEAIMSWLDKQPCSSVVFLCFGSMGSFDTKQVKEIASALELSGQRFLWSLRRPSQESEKTELLKDYEDYDEVLPEGFLERTSGIATWPIFAEQQTNAFHLVKELGLAVKIKLDYRQEYLAPDKSSELVTAEEIESGIRCLMNEEGEMRNKVATMKDICRKAVVEGGSSRISLTQFIEDVIDNINQRSTST